jgi:hypothetical protein
MRIIGIIKVKSRRYPLERIVNLKKYIKRKNEVVHNKYKEIYSSINFLSRLKVSSFTYV